jgi:transmembrane sensor
MTQRSFEDLLEGYIQNQLTTAELSNFIQLLQQPENEQSLKERIGGMLSDKLLPNLAEPRQADVIFNSLMQKARQEAGSLTISRPFYRRIGWFRTIAAAACLAVVIGSGVYFLIRNERSSPGAYASNVPPGTDKAVLTLSDGRELVLDAAAKGQLAIQDGASISQSEGKIVYHLTGKSVGQVYNYLTTPRGGRYNVQLSDGTLVWLNAGSSIRFPSAFAGDKRRVELTGEAYFEVAANKLKPFVVSVNGTEVIVLGTRFEVSAYPDEPGVTTTLIEGSVQIVSGKTQKTLKPGQQSIVKQKEEVRVVDSVSTEEAIAWKNGFFAFDGVDLETIMRQLSRWYDVEVVYNRKVEELFFAEIPRNTSLSDALKALELTGKVRFAVVQKKIIVEP